MFGWGSDMNQFRNILFVSDGLVDEAESLKQVLSLARNNNATLNALIICPEFSDVMTVYKDKFKESLKKQLQRSIQSARDALNLSEVDLLINIQVESGSAPAIRIVRQVLRHSYDLIVKNAAQKEDSIGFAAMDMELLRKCPCPVWLCRPIERHRDNIHVAVAIDPISDEKAGHDLSIRLLEISRSLADTCDGELNIISCWDHQLEAFLRNNIWIDIPDNALSKSVADVRDNHFISLEGLIKKSNISGKMQVHHVRGLPQKMIPQLVDDLKIDILVMGTVARTGIDGFICGNTAENILQKLRCSLLALKPNGFVCPVMV
jgi:universal stress protein E